MVEPRLFHRSLEEIPVKDAPGLIGRMLPGSVCLLSINYSHYTLPSGFDRVLANGLVFGEKNELFCIHLVEQLPITVNQLNASGL